MTTQEYVLTRSLLPKNGTYTMLDHMKSMLMEISGTCLDIEIDVGYTSINVASSKAELKVKESIIRLNIDIVTQEYTVEGNLIVEVVKS